MKVEIKEFRLFDDSVTLTLMIDARYEVKGKAKVGDKKVSIKAKGDVDHEIAVRASFRQEEDKLVIDPKIQRLKLEVKRLEMEPADLEGVEDRLKAVIKRNEANFLKDLNGWLTKNRGRSRGVGAGQDPVIRSGGQVCAADKQIAVLRKQHVRVG